MVKHSHWSSRHGMTPLCLLEEKTSGWEEHCDIFSSESRNLRISGSAPPSQVCPLNMWLSPQLPNILYCTDKCTMNPIYNKSFLIFKTHLHTCRTCNGISRPVCKNSVGVCVCVHEQCVDSSYPILVITIAGIVIPLELQSSSQRVKLQSGCDLCNKNKNNNEQVSMAIQTGSRPFLPANSCVEFL